MSADSQGNRRPLRSLVKSSSQVADRACGSVLVESMITDLKYAARSLWKTPVLTLIVVLTLAVGIGANTAIFSVVDAVLLRPLPYPRADRLVLVWSAYGNEGRSPASGSEMLSIQERSRLIQEFAGIWVQSAAVTGQGEPEALKVGWVTSNFLSLLAPRMQFGRFFSPEDQGSGAAPAIVLSDGLWRRRYGAEPALVGRQIMVSGRSCTLVGILPRNFRLAFPDGSNVPADLDAFLPFAWDLARDPRGQANSYIRVIGRLREGVTVMQAQAEADNIAAQLRAEFTEHATDDLKLQILPLHADVVRQVRPALLALFGGVGLVVLIACANVAGLLLARAHQRRKEIALRTALGARPSRIIRQLLTESIVLSCLGGAAGLGVVWVALRWLLALQPAGISRMGSIGLNPVVLGFTTLVSLGCGILFGLAPALAATNVNLSDVLKEWSRTNSPGRHSSRRILVAGEVALGFVLLAGAGLLVQTFVGLLHVNPGFRSSGVLTFQLMLPDLRYPTPESQARFVYETQRRLAALPGVQTAGAITHLPFDDDHPNWYSYYWRQGAPRAMQNAQMADHRGTLPGFFDSLHVTFVAGRNFDTSDEVANRKVAIVDDSLVRQTWSDGNAIGRHLNIENGAGSRELVEVIGVVKHVQFHSLAVQVRPQIFLPYQMAVRPAVSFSIATAGSPLALLPRVRELVVSLDKDLPLSNARLMDDYVAKAQTAARFTSMLAMALAGIALLLSCIGIYGVASSWVARRTSEIGIRMAVGARRAQILEMVIRQNMLPVLWGTVSGLALSLVLDPLLASLLFGVKPLDPGTFGTVAAVLFLVGALACLPPAYRAASADPVSALRSE